MDAILVVNAGSSSIKFSVYAVKDGADLALVSQGQIDGIGSAPRLRAVDGRGAQLVDQSFGAGQVPDVPAAMVRVAGWLRAHHASDEPVAVGHRVVHGGPSFSAPVVVDDQVLAELERLVPLAPLHQSYSIQPMRAVQDRLPGTLQVACFDTAFHRGHPEVADRYALPDDLYREGVRRYGFHGLSYEYIVRRLRTVAPEIARGRVVSAHLGRGPACVPSSRPYTRRRRPGDLGRVGRHGEQRHAHEMTGQGAVPARAEREGARRRPQVVRHIAPA